MKRFFLSFLTVLLLISAFPITVGAANDTVTGQIDIPLINADDFGNGYEWDNLDCVLKLDGLRLETTDPFGIKLPADSTVELNGDNYIKATSYAIYCLGAVTFTGKGTLTLVSAENGISCYGSSATDNMVFRSGKITVSGAKNGIFSENSPIIFSGAQIKVTATEKSVYGKDIKFVSGNLTLSGQVYAKSTVSISNVNLTVTSSDSAIVAAKPITFKDVDVSVGNTASSLKAADVYNGEKAIKTVATKVEKKNGFMFGGKLPAFVDYIVITFLALGAIAVIIVPIIIKKKKTAALIAQSEASKSKSKRGKAQTKK